MDEVLLRLALARQAADNANLAGTPRQAVADGYAAVDNVLSALLLNSDIEPPFNHARKLNLAKQHHPDAFEIFHNDFVHGEWRVSSDKPGLEWTDIEEFYSEWNPARYGSFEATSHHARCRAAMASTAVDCGVHYVAHARSVDIGDFYSQIAVIARGYSQSAKDEALGLIHDMMFSEAESMGERYGFKLGTKLAATTNYCALDVVAGDSLTRRIISEDKELAKAVADVYVRFVGIVDSIQKKRHSHLNGIKSVGECSAEEIDGLPDFMFALKARFHGATVQEMGKVWAEALADAMASIFNKGLEADE